jgi:hypothetical protein
MTTRWMKLVLLMGVLVMAVASVAYAEDPSENACYAGGLLAGKCDWPTEAEDEWAWNCGWYIAQAIGGKIPLSGIPSDCPGAISYFGTCYDSSVAGKPDIRDIAAPGTAGGLVAYASTNGSCSGGQIATYSIVIGTSPDSALSACVAQRGTIESGVVNLQSLEGYGTAPSTWFLCFAGKV